MMSLSGWTILACNFTGNAGRRGNAGSGPVKIPISINPLSCAHLEGRVAGDRDAVHAAPLARIVVEGAVLGAAVVPDGKRTNLPAKPAGEFRFHRMIGEKLEYRLGFGQPEAIERLRVIAEYGCKHKGYAP